MKINKRFVISSIIVFLAFILFALFITYPLILHMGSYATGLGDEYLISWIMNWDMHALFTNTLHIFNANIYFPYTNTLAYSDTHFMSAILAIPALLLIKQPVTVINFTFISSLVLLSISMYFLTKYVTKNFLLAFTIGVLIMFCPAVLDKRVHLQILAIEWVPLAMLCFIHFLKNKQLKFLLLSLLFFDIQTYNSFMPGYFILFGYVFLFIFYGISNRKKIKSVLNIRFILPFILALLVLLPIVIPYYQVSKEFNYTRDIREAIHLALQPEDYFYPAETTKLQPILLWIQHLETVPKNAETKPGYLGIVITVLTLVSFVYILKKWKKTPWEVQAFFAIAIFGFLMSLGPALHIGRQTIHYPFLIPLPYAMFYYIIPGFEGLRNSARWEMLFILADLVVVGYVLTQLLKHKSSKLVYLVISIILLGTIAEFNFPIHYVSIQTARQFPKVESWMTTVPENTVILQLPIYNWYDGPFVMNENRREFYSTIHFRKEVNGASGFSPPPWQQMVTTIWKIFPSDKSVKEFKHMGIGYLIIHKKEFDEVSKSKINENGFSLKNGNAIVAYCDSSKYLIFIIRFGDDYVYKIK